MENQIQGDRICNFLAAGFTEHTVLIPIMKRNRIAIVLAAVMLLLSAQNVFALSRKNYFYSSQAGLWFGPIAPLGPTADHIKSNLGGGAFFRLQMPWNLLKIGVDVSYQDFQSEGVNRMQSVPIRMEALFLLPFKKLPVNIQVKAAAGMSWMKVMPENVSLWDPLVGGGVEVSFPAGRIMNIGARVDYFYIMEGHKKPGAMGAHVFNAAITIYFNIF